MLKPISDSNDPALPDIKPLYETAFPQQERRTWEELMRLLNEPKMRLNAIMIDEHFIGFAIYWKLDDWLYLEHLAISAQLRGKEYGARVIEYLKGLAGRKIILETELPETDEAVRRIRFYERQGFKVVSYPYKQPPYRQHESPFPMMLMTTAEISKEECNEVVNMMTHEVYEKFY